MRVYLFGFCEDLANVADEPLDSVLMSFFLSLHHDDGDDDLVGSCQVEEHKFRLFWGAKIGGEESMLFNS